jgi:secernin
MCDTLYSANDAGGSAFFGKNSDRVPSEPQTLCIVPDRPPSDTLVVGSTSFAARDKGFAFCLSKPSWMAGGEMGVNAKGVAIGNEAVFSKIKPAKHGVLGMDILRGALAASATAKEAVDFIADFVETHDQGGNGAYKGSLYYNNSFIIADPAEAYILETAGHRWAWRRAESHDSISNAYCIAGDYQGIDAQTAKEMSPAKEDRVKGSWKHVVEDRFYLLFTKGEQRRSLSHSLLSTSQPSSVESGLGILQMMSILRTHGPFDPAHPHRYHMESLCVHSGGFPDSATTASMALEWKDEGSAILWFTGTSYPCLSLYKPILLADGKFVPLWNRYDYAEGSAADQAYWQRQYEWIRNRDNVVRSKDEEFVASRDKAQAQLARIAEQALSDLKLSGRSADSFHTFEQETEAVVAGWESKSH